MNKKSFNKDWGAYLRLTRPPNLITAVSDIWAGAALVGFSFGESASLGRLFGLSLASVFLYAGGVVLNDVYDAELDAIERPERPIPSGLIRKKDAALFGVILLLLGVLFASFVGLTSLLFALIIAVAVNVYDKWAKHHVVSGPLVMGICRGLNLLLGMSLLAIPVTLYWIPLVPIVYIAAITLISQGEVKGGNQKNISLAMGMYGIVILAILGYGITHQRFWAALVFLILFSYYIFPPLIKARNTLAASQVGKAVHAGVLGLILMNAAWIAVSSSWIWAGITALLLPLSGRIARYFEVT